MPTILVYGLEKGEARASLLASNCRDVEKVKAAAGFRVTTYNANFAKAVNV